MWIADGYKGVVDYRKQRMSESDRILFKAGDCFHDGERVLQSVADAHTDIENRLRRSDYVTKDVLDSLVDEMLWEDDRPNAKALSRKAEMVLTRARQRLSAYSGEEFSRSGSSQGRSLPPRLPPPTQALPPIPRGLPSGLSSITEQQPPNVEKWRAQISSSRRSQFSANGSDIVSPTLSNKQLSVSGRSAPLDLEKDTTTSTASWQLGDDRSRPEDSSSTASPNTPFTSPHGSTNFDFLKQNIPNPHAGQGRMHNQITQDERPRILRSQTSDEFRIPPRSQSRGVSYIGGNNGSTTMEYSAPPPPKYSDPTSYTAYSPGDNGSVAIPPRGNNSHPYTNQRIAQSASTGGPILSNQNVDPLPISNRPSIVTQTPTSGVANRLPPSSSQPIDEFQALTRAASKASSRISSAPSMPYSQAQTVYPDETSYQRYPVEEQLRPKSSKRGMGFSLFPMKSKSNRDDTPPIPNSGRPLDKISSPSHDSERRSIRSSISGFTGIDNSSLSDPASGFEYLSLNTCLEWKKAHKKVKKASKVPPLPGAYMLDSLNDRDHVFIVDDGASMEPAWPDVKRVFEALSYTVKGMSPDGTELFYTVAYDTYRRKDTSDLCDYLDKKTTGGVTNIGYRLNLQLQSYHAKILNSKQAKGKKAILRPMSFYILTNGEWDHLVELKKTIKGTADFLKQQGMGMGQVTIEFISFAQSPSAGQVMSDLETEDFGL